MFNIQKPLNLFLDRVVADNKELSDIYNFMHDGISTVVSVSNDLLSLNKDNSIDDALDLLIEKLEHFPGP